MVRSNIGMYVNLSEFAKTLQAAGGEILKPTNPYEVLRFRTFFGVGIVYHGRRGETWTPEAKAAFEYIAAGKGSVSPVLIHSRRKGRSTAQTLLNRDGDDCFFCAKPLGNDITVEHLVAISHGGPNHTSNLCLAHARCNSEAGHLPAAEKMRIALRARVAERNAATPVVAPIVAKVPGYWSLQQVAQRVTKWGESL